MGAGFRDFIGIDAGALVPRGSEISGGKGESDSCGAVLLFRILGGDRGGASCKSDSLGGAGYFAAEAPPAFGIV